MIRQMVLLPFLQARSIGVEGLLYRLPDGVMSCGRMLDRSMSACRGKSSSIMRAPVSAEEIEGMIVQSLWNTRVSGHGVLNGCWGRDVRPSFWRV